MIINCDTCIMRDIACRDCVVSSFMAPSAEDVSLETVEAIKVLSSRGIVPPMRFLKVVQG